jgi:hypothetical protein
MSKAHYDAFQALMPAGLKLHRGSAPDKLASTSYPYVVIGGNAGDESTEAYAGDKDSLDLRFKVTYAGLTFDSVLITIKRVRDTVLNSRLVVPGWSTTGFTHASLLDVRTDFDVTVPDITVHPVYAVDEFSVFSGH